MFSLSSSFPPSLPQTPFTFGLNQRAPYTTGDRCLLCRSERKDTLSQDSGQNGTSQSPKPSSAVQLPLYVCPDCKRTVEKDERQPPSDQTPMVRPSDPFSLFYSPDPFRSNRKPGFFLKCMTVPCIISSISSFV